MAALCKSVYVISLDRTPKRLAGFHARLAASGWPGERPRRVQAIDGMKVPKPAWFRQQPGAWGCAQTHLRLWEDAMNNDRGAICVFEDDCAFADDFAARLGPFLAAVPDDWDMIYLGGLLRGFRANPPERVNEHVYRLHAVTGTWSYMMTTAMMRRVYPFMHTIDRKDLLGHIDRALAEFHRTQPCNIYGPMPWLCGMDGGASLICGRIYEKPHFFNFDEETESIECQANITHICNGVVIRPLNSVRMKWGEQVSPCEFGRRPEWAKALLRA